VSTKTIENIDLYLDLYGRKDFILELQDELRKNNELDNEVTKWLSELVLTETRSVESEGNKL
jgi:hypothetical protein